MNMAYDGASTLPLDQPLETLRQAYFRRLAKNSHYSLRAYARDLRRSPSLISMTMAGKIPVSRALVEQLCDLLCLDPRCRAMLLFAASQANGAQGPGYRPEEWRSFPVDSFAVISDWYHYGILCLLEIPGAQLTTQWIASKLGISVSEAAQAIDRLLRLGLLVEREGRWKYSEKPLRVDNKVSTPATRKFQKQILARAIDSIDSIDLHERDSSALVFAMDAKGLAYAEKRITDFRFQLCKELEALGTPTGVYSLTIQLFPLSRMDSA